MKRVSIDSGESHLSLRSVASHFNVRLALTQLRLRVISSRAKSQRLTSYICYILTHHTGSE